MGYNAEGQSWKGAEVSGKYRIQREITNNKTRDSLAVNIIGTDPNAPLAYAPGSEHHCSTISKLGGHGGQ